MTKPTMLLWSRSTGVKMPGLGDAAYHLVDVFLLQVNLCLARRMLQQMRCGCMLILAWCDTCFSRCSTAAS